MPDNLADIDADERRRRVGHVGGMLLGPPKSRAGRRIVGVPEVIIPTLREHLAAFADDDPGALVFPGAKGGPICGTPGTTSRRRAARRSAI